MWPTSEGIPKVLILDTRCRPNYAKPKLVGTKKDRPYKLRGCHGQLVINKEFPFHPRNIEQESPAQHLSTNATSGQAGLYASRPCTFVGTEQQQQVGRGKDELAVHLLSASSSERKARRCRLS
jgi:hypothetical protein